MLHGWVGANASLIFKLFSILRSKLLLWRTVLKVRKGKMMILHKQHCFEIFSNDFSVNFLIWHVFSFIRTSETNKNILNSFWSLRNDKLSYFTLLIFSHFLYYFSQQQYLKLFNNRSLVLEVRNTLENLAHSLRIYKIFFK